MAPSKIRSAEVELHEPEISKPSPLRIIKRSKTITGSSPSREAFRGRPSSGSSLQSQGSPPMGVDRPLTVRKKRQGRGSVTNFSSEDRPLGREYEQSLSVMSGANTAALEDPNITPKACRAVPRTISAGDFLKIEFHQRNLDVDQTRYSVRSTRHSVHPQPQYNSYLHSPPHPVKNQSPKIPGRRLSKSKNFILRALGSRSSEDSKPIELITPKASKNSLIRRLSGSKGMASSRRGSRATLVGTDTRFQSEQNELDIAEADINGPIFDDNLDPFRPLSPPATLTEAMLVLSPRIIVTPEAASVPTTTCSFWVAIEVRGELHPADGSPRAHPSWRRCSAQSAILDVGDLRRYGNMSAMGIDLEVGRGCHLLDIVGDLHTAEMGVSETHFVLAKIQVDGVDANPSPSRVDPEILMADLQNHLGDTLTHYLTVKATYRHSAFTQYESNYAGRDGTYLHSTFMQTEARVAIRRHNPQSAWSPRTSQTVSSSSQPNPLVPLIDMHLPHDQAMQALRTINRDQMATHFTGQSGNTVESSDEQNEISASIDTAVMTPVNQTPSTGSKNFTAPEGPARQPPAYFRIKTDKNANKNAGMKSTALIGPFAPVYVRQVSDDSADDSAEEIDPARQIWANMRQASRGGRRHHPRKSVSADHYNSYDEGCSPSRLGSGQSSNGALRTPSFASAESGVELERNMIKEVALRNKRSVGTETLRSIAPSLAENVGKSKPSALGLALGASRFGWGAGWW